MTDISKCLGRNCLLKETCYRYTALADALWQSWSGFDKLAVGDDCKYYWNNEEFKEKQDGN